MRRPATAPVLNARKRPESWPSDPLGSLFGMAGAGNLRTPNGHGLFPFKTEGKLNLSKVALRACVARGDPQARPAQRPHAQPPEGGKERHKAAGGEGVDADASPMQTSTPAFAPPSSILREARGRLEPVGSEGFRRPPCKGEAAGEIFPKKPPKASIQNRGS